MISDYNGFVPNDTPFLRALPPLIQNESKSSPVRQLVDDLLEENRKARARILEHLIKDPGFVATLDEFEVIFDDLQIETDPETLRFTNETRIIATQSVRIRRRRKEEDGSAGVPLGGDPGGEAREGQ